MITVIYLTIIVQSKFKITTTGSECTVGLLLAQWTSSSLVTDQLDRVKHQPGVSDPLDRVGPYIAFNQARVRH